MRTDQFRHARLRAMFHAAAIKAVHRLPLLLIATAVCWTPAVSPALDASRYDLNGDGVVDAADIVNIVNYVNGVTTSETLQLLLPGGVTMELVLIPTGQFVMGSDDNEKSRNSDEGPTHTVHFAREFYLGRTLVTQAQWTAVMGSNPASTSTTGVGPDYPVHWISWNDINGDDGFLKRLNDHILNTGQGVAGYRLPSEAEWEYACRAGTQTRFFYGDSLGCSDMTGDCAAGALPGNRSDYMWYTANNSPDGCKPVGQKVANAFGLFDMHGHLLEWCQDVYHNSYAGAPTDGSAWLEPPDIHRILRGGYWNSYASGCRSARRDNARVHVISDRYGLRVARSR